MGGLQQFRHGLPLHGRRDGAALYADAQSVGQRRAREELSLASISALRIHVRPPKRHTSWRHPSTLPTRWCCSPLSIPTSPCYTFKRPRPAGSFELRDRLSPISSRRSAPTCLIVTAEEIVPEETLRLEAERNQIPLSRLHHVCHVPFGAHPLAVYRYYDYNPWQLKRYHTALQTTRHLPGIP